MEVPFDRLLLQRIFKATTSQESGKVFLAKDEKGKIAAAVFIIWDRTTAYYLIGGKDDDFGNSGAMSLLFWNALTELKNTVRSFDFEGSMLQGVENYFRSFGAEQKGFFQITKISSPLHVIKSGLRKALK